MATQLDTIHGLGFDALYSVSQENVSFSSGSSVPAIIGDIEERDELAEGGVRQIRSVRFAVKGNISPSIWSRVAVRGQTLQVLSVSRANGITEITAGGLAE